MACINCMGQNAKALKDLNHVRILAQTTAAINNLNYVIYKTKNSFWGEIYEFEPQVIGGNKGRNIVEVVNAPVFNDSSGVVLSDIEQEGIVAAADPKPRKRKVIIDGGAETGIGEQLV